ncbi:hypothetical protein KDX38_11785 [Pseudomonas sp. CDFA 602]|uniref:hypothetical protein n=1 Tax=Pseudomonas californiensis TaxID=2829823 RepID=UPI001E3CE450|nr:hypothetical protein [Pseudomonas californiensis]MCD5994395.1 hypothetical protein [Pseudomonas californiensis]MCD5999897.1 hypothetical protein [Pseudomonas californiensis]
MSGAPEDIFLMGTATTRLFKYAIAQSKARAITFSFLKNVVFFLPFSDLMSLRKGRATA